MRVYTYRRADERPAITITWLDDLGTPINFTGYTFTATARQTIAALLDTTGFTKSTGITGDAAGNVTITWATGDLGALAVGTWLVTLVATSGGLDRSLQFAVTITPT